MWYVGVIVVSSLTFIVSTLSVGVMLLIDSTLLTVVSLIDF